MTPAMTSAMGGQPGTRITGVTLKTLTKLFAHLLFELVFDIHQLIGPLLVIAHRIPLDIVALQCYPIYQMEPS